MVTKVRSGKHGKQRARTQTQMLLIRLKMQQLIQHQQRRITGYFWRSKSSTNSISHGIILYALKRVTDIVKFNETEKSELGRIHKWITECHAPRRETAAILAEIRKKIKNPGVMKAR
ncbi:hypothetical protein TELCIR_22568 [Teladorsagia circumcincta]|uniref:Uncharacterized protein n=1 Tax=Teladorsagia circumcincta TaxID=45464 RepID=A0A2G9TDT6_TELCI|nr:hypothetical protein TELCIR_22568 [Teladorsagia circumcincta]